MWWWCILVWKGRSHAILQPVRVYCLIMLNLHYLLIISLFFSGIHFYLINISFYLFCIYIYNTHIYNLYNSIYRYYLLK